MRLAGSMLPVVLKNALQVFVEKNRLRILTRGKQAQFLGHQEKIVIGDVLNLEHQ